MKIKISESEYRRRLDHVRGEVEANNAGALVVFGAKQIAYLSGYHVVATERPMALVVPVQGELVAFVPRLEVERVQSVPLIDEVWHYFEYPGQEPPVHRLVVHLEERGWARGKLLADSDGYPSLWGYQGPKLSERLPQAQVEVTRLVNEMWEIKSPEEIELIKHSAIWGNLAHVKLQRFTQVGESEIEISLRASYEASREMLETLGPDYGGHSRGGWPTHAGFITGPNSALPHAMNSNRLIRPGDVLITGATGVIDGYTSELERTMIVGQPTAEQRNFFEIMLEAQTAAIEAAEPGVPLADVDQATRRVFEQHNVTNYAQHHTGHHLGWEGHEPPFIDRDATGEMKPGQVYSIEPGLYLPGEAGYRHSDTILVTEDGTELITYYPRELEDLIVPV
ncbi:MAG: M24 family metallopeptidase [Candidatus Bipolaricaulia bacterium]